jgi:hypothetical protein
MRPTLHTRLGRIEPQAQERHLDFLAPADRFAEDVRVGSVFVAELEFGDVKAGGIWR